MADWHILAVHTYGSQRVKQPGTNQTVSAYKIGYSSAACETLLTLFGAKARDVSSPHASYRYVQIDGETTVRHGYLLLNVTADELARADAVTRRYQRAAVYLWQENRWLELPHGHNPAYAESAAHSGPGFNPSGFRPVAPSTGEKEAAVEGIRAEKSQRDPNQKPWYWILGDTYPQRETLKRHGARFSSKRRAWYYVGWELPDGIKRLITKYATPEPEATATQVGDDAPCSDEEAAAILGVSITSRLSGESPNTDEPPRLFQIAQTVYARHELETPDGKPVATGTRGVITRLYNRNAQHGWSYDVDFSDLGTGWYFERELTDLEPIPGIRITHGAVVPPGAALPPTDADLKRALVESGHQPEALTDESMRAEPKAAPEMDTSEEPQSIRIFKPQPLPVDGTPLDEVQTAIVQARAQPAPVLRQAVVSQKRTLAAVGQSYVGELTGSITGNVYCYGYAIHDGICVFVNMGGPRMAVEAIRAKFSKGEIVNCVPWDAPAVELTAGEGNSGMYHDFMQNIPEAKFTSLILCHDLLVNPNYGGKSTTFLLRTDEAQAAAKLKYHVTELVKVPVFDAWAGYLYHAGQTAMLVRPTRLAGDIDLLSVTLDIDAWTRLITGGVEQGVIALPTNS
jgi:GH24 family phage-related lysozyme (muramidase)